MIFFWEVYGVLILKQKYQEWPRSLGLHLASNPIVFRNLTWNLKMMVSKRNFLFWGLLFRFHVKFRGCNQIIAIAGSTYSDPCLIFQHSMWQVVDAKGTRDSWWNPPMSPPTFAGNMALSGYFQGIMVIMVVNNPLIRPNFLGGCAVLRTVALFCFSFDFLLFSAWKRIYLAKLLYFAKLGFPEIRGFPLLNHHLGWARVRSL